MSHHTHVYRFPLEYPMGVCICGDEPTNIPAEDTYMNQADIEGKEKHSYVETQITEMNAIIRRNEVDIYIIDNVEQDTAAAKRSVETQRAQFVETNEGLAKAIAALKKLKAELEA